MKKKKVGIGTGTLVAILLTLAVLTPVSYFAYRTVNRMEGKAAMDACRFSILKASEQKKMPGSQGMTFTPLNCKRDDLGDLVIKRKDVVDKDGKINQEKASKLIATAMAECWEMIGEGRRDPFSNWDEEGSYCMICKTIRFDDAMKKYYEESAAGQGKARGEDAFIQSPIPYMLDTDHKWDKNKENYFEYIYNVKGPESFFTEEDIDKMKKTVISDGSVILIKLYKHQDKDIIATILSYGLVIVGVVLIVIGGVITFMTGGTGAVIGVPIGAIGKWALVAGLGVTILGGLGFLGVAMFDPVNMNPFSECAECNGVGSLKLIPADFDMRQEVKIVYPKELTTKDEEIVEQGPYCQHLVN